MVSRPLLRVLSYNIHHGEGADKKIDLARIAGIIAAADPDLVALQEVDETTSRSVVSQADALGERLGMHAAFGPAISILGGRYGIAVLSRRPIEQSITIPLPNADKLEPRVALAALVRLDHGRPIVFANTHLEHFSAPLRLAQAQTINHAVPAWAASLGHAQAPMILAGDLNALPDSDVLGELTRSWINAGAGRTAPTFLDPPAQIDYVLLRQAARWRIVDHQVLRQVQSEGRTVETRLASDHCPVLVTLEPA